jgi:hypothetical protein
LLERFPQIMPDGKRPRWHRGAFAAGVDRCARSGVHDIAYSSSQHLARKVSGHFAIAVAVPALPSIVPGIKLGLILAMISETGCANDGVGVIIRKGLAGSDGRHHAGRPAYVGLDHRDCRLPLAADAIGRRLNPWKSNA